ncbi:uncharacterized protein N7498_005793 [Penicillium cinerascens]|uniref:FAD-binding PCMH-type domain-containing protein n=1 Tax=Penicillium cinerascens TaxID=70096 RepID=A0A9W9MP41_9EURO|nr:uncharacterized protein N7498_005793 [Penicillium cinerascens]KAJ5204914.1 hypothetical protein N7498_005793 [Penicillium cinerascens]
MKYLANFSFLGLACAGSHAASILTGTSVTTPLGSFNLSRGAACACQRLSHTSGGVIRPNSANYTAQAADAYWDVRADLSPACIFLPATANDVAHALEVFGSCDAQFAVRGGGHMNYPGSNNIVGGVLVGLSKLNNVKVNSDTVEVGPGLTWYDVYSALDSHGRVAIGGRMKTIGVPGLTLIGGFHYFNNKYGYAMDNVVSYDVALGNGTQITVDKDSHGDLFWALKGGANNFGIVTKFTLKTYDMPMVSTTIQVYNESGIPDFITAVCNAAKLDEEDPIAAGMIATVEYNATTEVVSASVLGVQEGAVSPPSQFSNFTAIPATTRINKIQSMKSWVAVLDSPKQMFRVMFSHKSMKPDPEVLYSIYNAWKDAVDEIADVEGLYPTFVTNVHAPSSARVALNNGIGNVWGLEAEPLILWQFSTGWALAQDDLRVEAWSRQLTERLHKINVEKGLASDFVYMGDAGGWQNPFAGFPAENVARMREIRSSYDPKGIFSRLNWGGFKLGI